MSIFKKVPQGHTWGWTKDEGGMTQTRLGSRLQQILVETPKFSYDQPVMLEKRGAVTVPYFQEENQTFVILVRQTRPCITLDAGQMYDEHMETGNYEEAIALLGNEQWEVPRGFPKRAEAVLSTAIREMGEETGIQEDVITSTDIMAHLNANSTFFAQTVAYVAAKLSEKAATSIFNQDRKETISSIGWFEISQVIEMITSGKVTCGMTAQGIFLLQNHLRNEQ